MTGNIWGGQQSPARSCGSHFPSEFNALTGCRYGQNEIDTLKRLSLCVNAMSINNHVPAVKMFTLCSYKCRDSAAMCRVASEGMWKPSLRVRTWGEKKNCLIVHWNYSSWFKTNATIQISTLNKWVRYKSVVAQLNITLLALETASVYLVWLITVKYKATFRIR